MAKSFIEVDSKDFMRDAKSISSYGYPVAVARAFKKLAGVAAEDVKSVTALNFKLHSDYITKGIRSTPNNKTQLKAAARSVEKYHDIEAAVYLRPGSGKHSMAFMVDHEDGDNRTGIGKLAIPAHDLKNYSYKTNRGAVRKAWRPSTLLKYYNMVGPNKKGNKLSHKKTRGGKGKAFILTTKSGVRAIVRRKNKKVKSLEFLYLLKSSADIKKQWDFETTVDKSVHTNYRRIAARYLNAMRPRK